MLVTFRGRGTVNHHNQLELYYEFEHQSLSYYKLNIMLTDIYMFFISYIQSNFEWWNEEHHLYNHQKVDTYENQLLQGLINAKLYIRSISQTSKV